MNTLEWLSQLIAFDTTSRNSNMELIDHVQEWFKQHDLLMRLTRHPNEEKTNLFATLPAHNGSMDGGIVLSGHTDVVPVDGQQWNTNPFAAVQHDGKVYGRGACDMKGFLAVALALVPEFRKLKLSCPVHFALSYDEEIGCQGAPLMIADLEAAGIRPAACIVGEPTDMRPVVAHKGIQTFRCRVRGHAAHSSLTPQGCNAIEYAAQLICHIRSVADGFRQSGPFDNKFDVPFTTVSTNMINGGIAHNIIPAHCEFYFEFRHLPNVKPREVMDRINAYVRDELLPRMQRERTSAEIEIDHLAQAPAFESNEESSINQLIRSISGDKEIHKVAYATEAGLFQNAQIPTIVCGPGNIEQAHRANEFVTLEQLKKCEEFLLAIVQAF
jgi:acetylornithine deacetylase